MNLERDAGEYRYRRVERDRSRDVDVYERRI
jgi:hypothetical protein